MQSSQRKRYTSIKIADFSTKTMKARKQQNDVLKVW